MSSEIEQLIEDQKVKYFYEIRRILNKNSYLFTRFTDATPQEDMNEGFDAVFSFPEVKIPIRIRNFEYQRYMDITIRSKSACNQKTEIHKLREGFGDYYFYCWLDKERRHIEKYAIIDLHKFRSVLVNEQPDSSKKNTDGTEFFVFTVDRLVKTNSIVMFEIIRQP